MRMYGMIALGLMLFCWPLPAVAQFGQDPATQPINPSEATARVDLQNEQVLISAIRTDLDETKAELAKTKQIIGEVIEGQRLVAQSKELPPLKDAEVRVFQLQNTKAEAAAEKIDLLFGSEPLRIAVDEASNGLIVFGKAEAIPQVEQLIAKLDDLAVAHRDGLPASNLELGGKQAAAVRRTLLLRVFWLADGGAQDLRAAEEFLPLAVIDSLVKLGISSPRLVTQTVNSLSVEEGGSPVEFSTNVPAMMFEQPVTLVSSGTMGATTDGRAEVDMQLSVGGAGVNCELKGSLATPLGHFMVLGTANSVIPEYSAGDPAAAGFGTPLGRAIMTGKGVGGGGVSLGAAPTKYNASRFAFVVQVIEAESFEPAAEGK